MTQFKTTTGKCQLLNDTLTIEDAPGAIFIRWYEYYRRLVLLGIFLFLFLVVGSFYGRSLTSTRVLEFMGFIGRLVLISIAIALFIVVVIKRQNPLPSKSDFTKPNTRSIPLADITEARLPENKNSIRLTIESQEDVTTEELYYLPAMKEERRRAIDLFESYGIPVEAN